MSQPATEMKHGGRFHVDDRGTRYCSIFPEIGKGDINVTVVEPGAAARQRLMNGRKQEHIVNSTTGQSSIRLFNGTIYQNEMLTKDHSIFRPAFGTGA